MNQIIDALEAAREALLDLNACNNPNCTENNCSHALAKIDGALAAARKQQPDTPGLGDDFIDALEAFLRDVDMNIGGLEGWREIFNPRTADTFYSHAENLRAALAAAREQQPLTDEQIIAIRDEHLPSQGEPFDCIAFARAVLSAAPPAQDAEDAARYRWLRECHAARSDRTMLVSNSMYSDGVFIGKECLFGDALDAAIDAARGSEHGR